MLYLSVLVRSSSNQHECVRILPHSREETVLGISICDNGIQRCCLLIVVPLYYTVFHTEQRTKWGESV